MMTNQYWTDELGVTYRTDGGRMATNRELTARITELEAEVTRWQDAADKAASDLAETLELMAMTGGTIERMESALADAQERIAVQQQAYERAESELARVRAERDEARDQLLLHADDAELVKHYQGKVVRLERELAACREQNLTEAQSLAEMEQRIELLEAGEASEERWADQYKRERDEALTVYRALNESYQWAAERYSAASLAAAAWKRVAKRWRNDWHSLHEEHVDLHTTHLLTERALERAQEEADEYRRKWKEAAGLGLMEAQRREMLQAVARRAYTYLCYLEDQDWLTVPRGYNVKNALKDALSHEEEE